jgi:hypothetical protein
MGVYVACLILISADHSCRGDGLGDHGLEGIKNFVEGHECSRLCKKLALCSIETLVTTLEALEREKRSPPGEDEPNEAGEDVVNGEAAGDENDELVEE